MILLDTHIWIWWVQGGERLTAMRQRVMEEHEADGLGVSVISCWEGAKLTEVGRLQLPMPTLDWLNSALVYPGVQLMDPLLTADRKLLDYPHVQTF